MKIYIYWEMELYFTSFEDVLDYYEDSPECTTFNDFLSKYYINEEIFNFTEAERESVIEAYRSSLAVEVEDWISDYCAVVEIEAECKEM
jgi:hypothetical protein